jgi:hypothetical protein
MLGETLPESCATSSGISQAIVARLPESPGRSVRDHATRFARLARTSMNKNRLKNRFSFVVSNGDFLQVLDFAGAPGTIRTSDPQIRSLI